MNKTVLGLDLGSNSIGWALLSAENDNINGIKDCGVRIFPKAVEDKVVPTPKNKKRRDMRLGRRLLQRRARRKQVMLNYLISLNLLPKSLEKRFNDEKLLNELGSPYELRAKGLDNQLTPHQLGRILLHFVARRGFLSSKKQLAGDLIDDPDTMAYIKEQEEERMQKLLAKGKKPKIDDQSQDAQDAFKTDIANVYQAIKDNKCRTLGEYLYKQGAGKIKRNRNHDGGHLRTDRAMYQKELLLIWQKQQQYFSLPGDFIEKIEKIIFYQRPLKLKKDRVGKCSFEHSHYRARMARLEVQKFRYWLDINNLTYTNNEIKEQPLTLKQKTELANYFEHNKSLNITNFRKLFGFDKKTNINLEMKNLKGNITACDIREIIGETWNNYTEKEQKALVEDLLSIQKKSTLKKRLINYWNFNTQVAIKLCLVEFEPEHSNLSLKAINNILPYLKQGLIYSKKDKETAELGALQLAGYVNVDEEVKNLDKLPKLPAPPETSNPIVNKGLQELRRVINAIIKEHGKPNTIRVEMARDLEMNTQRVKDFIAQQKRNEKLNQEAEIEFKQYNQNPNKRYASKDDKIKYRLWKEQKYRCVYSDTSDHISLNELWTNAVQIDHIVPRSLCLDNSYINKVLCKTKENTFKGQRTPIETWGNDKNRWHQITQKIEEFYPDLPYKKYRKSKTHPKKRQFFMKKDDIAKKYSMSAAQLNDTRYISKLAQDYLAKIISKNNITVTKGAIVAEVRHLWGLNSLIGEKNKKERTDHRHHTIDAVVIANMDLGFHNKMTQALKDKEEGRTNKINIYPPFSEFKNKVDDKLKDITVSHCVQRKLSGALHEETGANYLALKDRATGKIIKQGLVYRKTLNSDFTLKNSDSIVDDAVRVAVQEHILNYDEDVKKAFTEEALKELKLGKNSIKRVRVWQSNTNKTKLEKTKFAVKDKSGKVFKYMSYGNYHHVEIIKHKDKIKGVFITAMEAKRRAVTLTKSAKKRGINPEAIINKNHGDRQFLFALHKNDLVSVKNEQGQQVYYRIQKLQGLENKLVLRLHTAATLKNKLEELNLIINEKNFNKYQIKLHKINAIGKLLDDKAYT